MESQTISPIEIRKPKFLMILPVFALPFIGIFFYLLGGGKSIDKGKNEAIGNKGFNMVLPAARLKSNRSLTKMAFYQQADKDSVALEDKMARDPYYVKNTPPPSTPLSGVSPLFSKYAPQMATSPPLSLNGTARQENDHMFQAGKNAPDANERKVYEKIEELNRAMNASAPEPNRVAPPLLSNASMDKGDINSEEDRLERLMSGLKEKVPVDPEIEKYDAMLDKLIALRKPASPDSIKQISAKYPGKTYAVGTMNDQVYNVSLLQAGNADKQKDSRTSHARTDTADPVGFYGLEDQPTSPKAEQNAIKAAVDEDQILVSGADIRMRLTTAIYIDGTCIPAGNPITGLASLSGERLHVEISSIRYQNAIYPVKLSVYDVDGVSGIYIPGSINRDVSKQSADQAVGEMNLMPLDQSIGAQAATAGIQAAKAIASKKIRLVRVSVKDGYQVFLRESR